MAPLPHSIPMSVRVKLLREEFEYAFQALDRSLKGIDDEMASKRLTEESNSVKSIAAHLAREVNINVPRIIKGDFTWIPPGWPVDYQKLDLSIVKLTEDLVRGEGETLRLLSGLSDDQLEEVLHMMSGPYPRRVGLYAYLGEVFHHSGQIAFIRGSLMRLSGVEPSIKNEK